jgi:hypothetical protein
MQTEMIRNKTKYSVPRQAFCDKTAKQAQKRLFSRASSREVQSLLRRGRGSRVFALYRLVQGDS